MMGSTMRIESPRSRWRYALVRDTDDGVEVQIWRSYENLNKLEGRHVVDAPFHVVCDLVHHLVVTADPPVGDRKFWEKRRG
jgi:hypothetical protein